MLGRVTLTVAASEYAAELADAMVGRFASEAGLDGVATDRLAQTVQCLVAFSVERSYEGLGGGDIEVSLELDEGGVLVDVHDWGIPFRRGGGDEALPPGLEVAVENARDVRLVNLAGDGKRLFAHVDGEHQIAVARVIDGAADPERARRSHAGDAIEIRDATPEDATGIAQVLFRGYGLGYVHADFYRPAWVEEQLVGGRVSSTVAVADGDVVGHHAILVAGEGETAESGVAVIAHEWRGLGLFDRMFDRTVERARGLGIPALSGYGTTAHVYSQRSEWRAGYRPVALLLGAVAPQVAALQGGEAAGRIGLLLSVLPLGSERAAIATVPAPYGEVVARVIAEAGIDIDSVEHDPVPGLELSVEANDEVGWAILRVSGEAGVAGLADVLRGPEVRGASVVFADVDLACPSERAVEMLRDEGFYLAGVVPFDRAGRTWLRLQRPQAVMDLDALHIESETGTWLLEQVLADRGL